MPTIDRMQASLTISTALLPSAATLIFGFWAAFVATWSTRRARQAFLGQNFLKLMDKMQEHDQRQGRGRLKANLRGEQDSGQPIRFIENPSAGSEQDAADKVAQLFDQVGIVIKSKMVGKRTILNNWSVTIVQMFVITASYIRDRRERDPTLWHAFVSLARDASQHKTVPSELRIVCELLHVNLHTLEPEEFAAFAAVQLASLRPPTEVTTTCQPPIKSL